MFELKLKPISPILITDSYKLSHKDFEVEGVTEIYSNFTPRFTHYFKRKFPFFDDKIVVFGLQQAMIKIVEHWSDNFFKRPKAEVIAEAKRVLVPYIGMENLSHFEELHDLGYLPLEIRALKEGSVITKGIPTFTIRNTLPKFEWLPNYLESVLSAESWKSLTVANIARQYRQLSQKYAELTADDWSYIAFQNHDFSFRGQAGWDSSAMTGAGWALFSAGSDNTPAIWALENYYGADIENETVFHSIPASEHSVTTLGINFFNKEDLKDGETQYLKWVLTERFKTGLVAFVLDSYDYFRALTEIIPSLKNEIMGRDGKLVIRGDSGEPVNIIAGYRIKDLDQLVEAKDIRNVDDLVDRLSDFVETYENEIEVVKWNNKYYRFEYAYNDDSEKSFQGVASFEEMSEAEAKGTIEVLWEIFGGEVNSKGFKILDSHIGHIYGDGMNYERSESTLKRLAEKGFCACNIVFGVGSFTLNMLSRDDLGIAVKATNAMLENNVQLPLFKAPKTDSSKKSLKGYLKVYEVDGTITYDQDVTFEQQQTGLLETVFLNGQYIRLETLKEIRELAEKSL